MTQLAVEGEIESWAACILEKSLTGFAMLIAFSLIFLVVAYILKKYDEGKFYCNSSFISSLFFEDFLLSLDLIGLRQRSLGKC